MIEQIKNLEQHKYAFQKYSNKEKTSSKAMLVWINWEKAEMRWNNQNEVASYYSKISLRDITDIQVGFKSQNLQRYRFYPGLKYECCLSIYYLNCKQEECLDLQAVKYIELKQFLQILQDILICIDHPIKSYITNRQLCFTKAKMKLMQYANQKEKLTLNTYLRNKIFNRTTLSIGNKDEDSISNKVANRENENQQIISKTSSINLNQFKVDQQKYQNQPNQKRIQYQYNEIQTQVISNKNFNSETGEIKKLPNNSYRTDNFNTSSVLQAKDTQNSSYKNLKKVIQLSNPQQDRFQESKFRKSKYSSRHPHLEFLHTSGSNKSLSVSEKSILNLTNGLLSPEIHNSIKQKIRINNDNISGNIIQRYIKSNSAKQFQQQDQNKKEIRILDQFQAEQQQQQNGVQENKINQNDEVMQLRIQIQSIKQKLDEVSQQKYDLEQSFKQQKQQLLKEKTLNAALKEQLAVFKNNEHPSDINQSPIQKPFIIQTSIYSPSSLLIKSPQTKQAEDIVLIQNLQRQVHQERQQNNQLNCQIQDLQSLIKSITLTQKNKIKDQLTNIKQIIEEITNKQQSLKKEFNSSLSQMKKIFQFLGSQIVDSERRALQLEKEKEDLVAFIDHHFKDAKGSQKSLSFLEDDTKTTNYSTN